MLTTERSAVMNFEGAIRGARNPMNSWDRMDSYYDEKGNLVERKNFRQNKYNATRGVIIKREKYQLSNLLILYKWIKATGTR